MATPGRRRLAGRNVQLAQAAAVGVDVEPIAAVRVDGVASENPTQLAAAVAQLRIQHVARARANGVIGDIDRELRSTK